MHRQHRQHRQLAQQTDWHRLADHVNVGWQTGRQPTSGQPTSDRPTVSLASFPARLPSQVIPTPSLGHRQVIIAAGRRQVVNIVSLASTSSTDQRKSKSIPTECDRPKNHVTGRQANITSPTSAWLSSTSSSAGISQPTSSPGVRSTPSPGHSPTVNQPGWLPQ